VGWDRGGDLGATQIGIGAQTVGATICDLTLYGVSSVTLPSLSLSSLGGFRRRDTRE